MKVKMVLLILGIGAAVVLPIYFTSHPYTPKAFVPYLFGIIGAILMIVGALFYVLRKRIKALKNFGKMKYWLDAHIVFCLLGPLLVVYHSAFKVSAPNSAIAYYVMLLMVASGVVGRYVYRHFQFSLSGERTTLRDMSDEVDQLDLKIKERFSDSQKIIDAITEFFKLREIHQRSGLISACSLMVRLDWRERRLRRQIDNYLLERGKRGDAFKEILTRRIGLEKKISTLEVTTQIFSVWHKLHVPIVWTLLITFMIHVAAVLIF